MKRRPNNKTLDNCDIHKKVLDLCIDDLNSSQAFNKERVLTRLNLLGVGAAIYWDYIRFRIENTMTLGEGDEKIELLPVSATFFKRRRKHNMGLNSLLAGPGGKAAGFALATVDGGQIALATVVLRKNQLNGAKDANRERARNLAKTLDEAEEIANAIRKAGDVIPTFPENKGLS